MKLVQFLLLLSIAYSCPIIKNELPLLIQSPKLIQTVLNGEKYLLGDLDNKELNFMYVANLKGTPEQMGRAFGELFKDEIRKVVKDFYAYYIGQLQTIVTPHVPKFLVKKIGNGAENLLKRVLDLNVMITKKYTNSRYFEEMKGIASGANFPVKDLQRLNMFPELIKAACTVAGVWKNATDGGQTLHVRALDWDAKNPISRFPLVAIYHPSDPKLQTHANFGWVGFVGSMTGFSTKISLGQKVWLPPKHSVKTTRYGNPWTFVFRDLLYDAVDMKSALTILSTTHRTCSIHIGIASAQDSDFRMLEYAENIVNNYDDTNYSHYTKNHPKASGIAYFDKHVQPSGDSCVGDILTNPALYGNWNIDSLWRTIGLSHQTGDTQLAVFDLENQLVLISYAASDASKKAYERNPFFIDMGLLFKPF